MLLAQPLAENKTRSRSGVPAVRLNNAQFLAIAAESIPTALKAASVGAKKGTYTFRTLSQRNVGLTGPYMHNGVFQTLKQVMVFYDDIGEPIFQNSHVSVP